MNASDLINQQEAYRQKMQAQLDQLEADFQKMRAKSEELQAEAKLEAKDRLERVEQQLGLAKSKLAKIKDVSQDAWDEFKGDLEEMVDNLRSNLEDGQNVVTE